VVLIDGSTDVRFLAHPRFAQIFSFLHIGLTGDLIYINPRRLDFLSYASLFSSAPPLSSCATGATPLFSSVPPPLLYATTVLPRRRRTALAPPMVAPSVVAPLPLPRSRAALAVPPRLSSARAAAAPQPPLLGAVAAIHSRTIHHSIRRLVPSLNPPCHGSQEEEGQGARG
jgi:hypothetical protein